MKEFNQYQEFTKSIAAYNTDVYCDYRQDKHGTHSFGMPWAYPSYAIAEEAGEVCGKIAKFIRKSNSGVADTTQLKADIGKELGDLLYQVSETARQFGFTLEEIAAMNYAKLTDRVERGVLIGEGDDR